MIEGIFFNESSQDFDPSSINIYASESLIEISAPSGFNLDDFEAILVYLNFTAEAYSDYTQFRLLDNAITNHPEAPAWTTNDSLYVDFEYHDIDYFLLVEDYTVGSEDSLFEYLTYMRNNRFVEYLEVSSVYEVDKSIQPQTFDNFTKVNDYSSKLELHDFDMDCEHEIVIQKDDITRDGVFDSLKYGYVNPAGEITFHTLLQQATSTEIYTDKKKETKMSEGYQLDWKDIYRKYYIFVEREITAETLITNRIDTYGILIQKDLDGDGNADKEVVFDTMYATTTLDTLTKEITYFYWKPTVNNPAGHSHRGQLIEWRNSTTVYCDATFSFTFKDFDGMEASSIRYYEDLYPNELSEVYNLDNYLVTITNDNNDDDPSNDVVVEAPNLEALLSISDSYDGVPAMFDHRTTIEDGEVIHENLLATTKIITIPDGFKAVSGVVDEISSDSISLEVIEVVPENGVYFDSTWIYSYGSGRTDGSYYYFDENGDGVFSTIFILDSTDTLIGIGFDYDANAYFEPGKRQVVEKHIICGKPSGWKKEKYDPYTGELEHYYVAMSYSDDKLVHFQDTDHYDGVFFDMAFGDVMFDIWKMEYSYGTSKLIEESQALTHNRFVESVSSHKWDDVWEQVETQLMALAISQVCGYVAKAIAYAIPYTAAYAETIGKIVEAAAYMISYAIITAINAYIEKRDLDYYIRSQTFHNVDYEGKVTLSDKLSADDFDDSLMTHAFFGSETGIYAPIQVETDKHLYQGQVVLAPRGLEKTVPMSGMDVQFKDLTLDYSLQTRSYTAYSDYSDPRMKALFFGSSMINPLFNTDLPHELYNIFLSGLYMENSIMYLEDEISRVTTENHEEHYDTIMPYMMYGFGTYRPSLKFASSEGNIPLPEFYEEYPIFVPEEYYDEVKDEHHLIYKVFDGSTYELQLVPEYSVHEFHSDIESIDVFLVGIEGDECVKCELKGTLYDDGYSLDPTTGILTIDEEKFATFKTILDSEIESADYESYLCLKLYVEKFRSMSDNRTLTSEEVGQIATMQSAQAKMLEYLYQFTIAEVTQSRLDEIEHTIFVTFWSTAILLGISAVNSFVSGAVSGGLAKGLTSLSTEALKSLYRIPSEIFQELYIDPFIENYVSKTVERAGGSFWEQVLWSSLAEGARETLTGSVFNAFKSSMQRASIDNIQGYRQLSKIMDRSSIESDIRSQVDEMKAQLESTSLKDTGGQLVISTLMLFSGILIGSFVPIFIGQSIASGIVSLKTVFTKSKISLKTMLNKIYNPDPYAEYDLLRDITWNEISDAEWLALTGEVKSLTVSSISKENIPITSEKVNSESRLLGNFIENRPIGFTQEVVEKVYEFLPSEQKYIIDKVGNVWQPDPVGVVRSALEMMEYQLDPS